MTKPNSIDQTFWDNLSEKGKETLLLSMWGNWDDEYENKYGRRQLHRFDEAIANYKNYNEIKNRIEGAPGYDCEDMIRPTVLRSWDFLVKEYYGSNPETVEEHNYQFEQMVTKWQS